jgi:hypothetical protein
MFVQNVKEKQWNSSKSLKLELKQTTFQWKTPKTYIPSSSGRIDVSYWNYRLVEVDGSLGIYKVTYFKGIPQMLFSLKQKQPSFIIEAFASEPLKYDTSIQSFIY